MRYRDAARFRDRSGLGAGGGSDPVPAGALTSKAGDTLTSKSGDTLTKKAA